MRAKYLVLIWLATATSVFGTVFQNPIISAGADPTCIYWNSNYYYMHTDGGLYVRKAPHLVGPIGIGNAPGVSVFTPSAPNNQNIWAPELKYINGEWYIYFAAGTANDPNFLNQRMYCIKANSQDPQGSYTMMGKVYDPNADYYAIDGNVLQTSNGSLYFVWSGRASGSLGNQNLYIAPMSNPWTISGPRVLLSRPTYSWEGGINEAPTFVTHNGVINLVYSANGGSTDNYCLGLLANSDGNVTNPGSWVKNLTPIFQTYIGSDGSVYAPGSCTFTKSVDGTQDWIVFHTAQHQGAGWNREIHTQSFTWTPGFNTPSLGHPFPDADLLAVPSGEAMVPTTTSREAHLRLQDGRMMTFNCGASDGSIWYNSETTPGGSWGALSGSGFTQFDVTKLSDERFSLLAVSGGPIWQSTQTNYNGGWGNWTNTGGSGFSIVDGDKLPDGRMYYFGNAPGSPEWFRYQVASNGIWGSWTNLGGSVY